MALSGGSGGEFVVVSVLKISCMLIPLRTLKWWLDIDVTLSIGDEWSVALPAEMSNDFCISYEQRVLVVKPIMYLVNVTTCDGISIVNTPVVFRVGSTLLSLLWVRLDISQSGGLA